MLATKKETNADLAAQIKQVDSVTKDELDVLTKTIENLAAQLEASCLSAQSKSEKCEALGVELEKLQCSKQAEEADLASLKSELAETEERTEDARRDKACKEEAVARAGELEVEKQKRVQETRDAVNLLKGRVRIFTYFIWKRDLVAWAHTLSLSLLSRSKPLLTVAFEYNIFPSYA